MVYWVSLTSVWTIKFLENLILRTQLYTSITLFFFICCISLSIAMKIPLRPIPALNQDDIYKIMVCGIYTLLHTYLQCTSIGLLLLRLWCLSIFLWNSRSAVACLGSLWSGQAVKWNWCINCVWSSSPVTWMTVSTYIALKPTVLGTCWMINWRQQ